MNYDELSAILKEHADINVCPICGTPFDKRYKQQKTCGSAECKYEHKLKYMREHRRKQIETDKAAYNKKHAAAQKKYRNKQKNVEIAKENLEKVEAYWEYYKNRFI